MKNFKLWYFAQSSLGVVQWVGIAILLTPLIIDRTGSGLLLGEVMALIGGFGIVAPLIGWLADRFEAHRMLQKVAILSHFAAMLVLYFAGDVQWMYWVVGLLIGTGTVTQLTLNPAFVIAASSDQSEEGRGLAWLFQSQFFGIIVAALFVYGASALGLGTDYQLLILMGLVLLCFLAVLISPPPAVKTQAVDATEVVEEKPESASLLGLLVFLIAVFFAMLMSGNLMETGPLIIQKVFEVEMTSSALGLAMSAVVTILLLEPAGRWMQKSGPYKPWMTAMTVYLVVNLALYGLMGTQVPGFLPILLIMILMQAISWFDMAIPAIAVRLSPASPALTQGILMFAMAGGFAVGSYIAGGLIDAYGFESVIEFCCVSMGIAYGAAVLTQLTK
ncbi:MFS transporter [Paraferrimonas sedimenticola]|uniref:MFS transporter n=1 Tax=Paraferrimonas sedimenticola TaxID=375674 RepID=A0AA37RW69_9GAMM|nr:MFS transporter [Paraferrimonas sedimenticola]GLP96233.1 hypothetical protein GCM10007895_15390 [Paraferrimonas sedimenticola]